MKTFVINLDKRRDRWDAVSAHLPQVLPWQFERFSAIPGDGTKASAVLACRRSHLELLRMQMENGWNRMMVVEDDAAFHRSISDEDLNADFSVLYFGANHYGRLLPYSKTHKRCTASYSTVAYVSTLDFAQSVLSRLQYLEPIDVTYVRLQKEKKALTVFPGIVVQTVGFSDIEMRVVDYDKYYGQQK